MGYEGQLVKSQNRAAAELKQKMAHRWEGYTEKVILQ